MQFAPQTRRPPGHCAQSRQRARLSSGAQNAYDRILESEPQSASGRVALGPLVTDCATSSGPVPLGENNKCASGIMSGSVTL
eukprot:9492082-Pyramimonas_sp.AAC.1